MKQGDLVRFAKWEEVDNRFPSKWHEEPKPYVGMLIEHDKLMGNVQVLHEGELYKIRSVFAEKAGQKDIEKYEQSLNSQ